jgi:hypothetical protein
MSSAAAAVALASQGWGPVLCRGLYDMWTNSVNCDTVIYSNDGHTYNAHASVLMASSPFLNRLLLSKKKQVFSVEIKTISSDIWKALLKFIYSGEVNVERAQLENLLEAAEKLEIGELSHQCLQQLNNQPLASPMKSEAEEDMVQNLSMKKGTWSFVLKHSTSALLFFSDIPSSSFLSSLLLPSVCSLFHPISSSLLFPPLLSSERFLLVLNINKKLNIWLSVGQVFMKICLPDSQIWLSQASGQSLVSSPVC